MNIREAFYCIKHIDITKEYIALIRIQKSDFSNSDRKFLLSIIGKFKEQDIEKTLRAIKMYSIWEPDEAIMESRKKGVFRYKAYGFGKNQTLFLLKDLIGNRTIFEFSESTYKYLIDKENLYWLYDFYKDSEEKLIQYIKEHHSNRERVKRGKQTVESALFKDLLAYIDVGFYFNSHIKNRNYLNKNILNGYSKEEICEGISYIVFLYDRIIGIKQDVNYFINSKYVLSDEIEKIILIACKVIQLQEWELCIDYFDYNIKITGNEWIIFDKSLILEKSIRMGFIRGQMQEGLHYMSSEDRLKDTVSITQVGEYIENKLGDIITKEISDGKLSRYRFEFPEPLFFPFRDEGQFGNAWFMEEILSIGHCAKELIMSYDEVAQKKITPNCKLLDIVLFQRFFLLMNEIASKILFKKKDENKIITSLIPSFKKDILLDILDVFVKDRLKSKELLSLFTYQKDVKLDLQYTPFLQASGGFVFSNALVAKSNLLRNAIAYSYLVKNQTANDDQGLEPLVQECSNIFKECKAEYNVFTNKKYKYKGKEGEVDVLVVSDKDIILIECKSPLIPINNFEMRSSLDHIEKANKQLNLSKEAFKDKAFRSNYFKAWGIEDKNQNIRTCIVFGNRLFTGYNLFSHPIRYIYELDMVLNKGIIYSEIGDWSVWKDETFSHDDLLDFLSDDRSFIRFNYESMNEVNETMFVKGKKIIFKTYLFNIAYSFQQYDSNLRIIRSNDELKNKIYKAVGK